MDEGSHDTPLMRGFRMKFRPTLAQRRYLARAFGVGRFVWNWGLSVKREAYQQEQKSVGFLELSRRLTALRVEKPWLTEVDRQLQTQSLRDLERAYQNFFAKRARFPKYKSRRAPQSVRCILDSRSARKLRAWAEPPCAWRSLDDGCLPLCGSSVADTDVAGRPSSSRQPAVRTSNRHW